MQERASGSNTARPKLGSRGRIPALTNVKAVGLKVRILMSGEVNERSISKISSLAELRLKENMFGGGVIVDATEVILLLGRSSENRESLAIWSDHAGLASFAKNYFEFLWTEAGPPSKLRPDLP